MGALAALLLIAGEVLAAGPKCPTVVHMNTGDVICSQAACSTLEGNGTCKAVGSWDPKPRPDGWHPNPQKVTEWTYNAGTGTWTQGPTHDVGEKEVADCECVGPEHEDEEGTYYEWVGENTCCDLVKVKAGTGFKVGTMGKCATPDCPAANPKCKPQMNAGGFLAEATCQE